MGRVGRWGAVVLVLLAAWPARVARAQRGSDDAIDPTRVLTAIDRAVGYLKRAQNPRGGWNDPAAFPGGVSALATLALLNAGLTPDDPAIAKALDYLREAPRDKTYVVSLVTMALAAGEPRRDLVTLQKNVEWLERAQQQAGEGAGGWGYGQDGGRPDPSNAQFALLALYDAQHAGARVKPETWRLAAAYWRKGQNRDGSWSYPGQAASGSMTAAGIAALVIADLGAGAADAKVEGQRVLCCQPHDADDGVDRGLEWLGRNFSIRKNPGGDDWYYYYLYGLERAGRLSARRFVGQHDWYREGTAQLVRTQDSLSHTWQGRGSEGFSAEIPTSLALLFLSKGRRPILMAKLHTTDDEAWNPHRRDAAHLTDAAERAWRLPMTWQVVDPRAASVDDLTQAPVLYHSGAEVDALVAQSAKLRDYLDRGGFLLVESGCETGTASRDAVERLVAAVFPEPEHRLRRVEPSHPLWRMERLVRPESPYAESLWGVEYGCRTCLVFCERDLSCYWELASPGRDEAFPPAVRARVADAEGIGLNVLAYATGREPKGKEQQFVEPVERLVVDGAGTRGVIEVAKLRHAGGCNDAPGALANLLRVAAQGDTRLRVAPEAAELSPDDPALRLRHLAFMHGRRDFRLTAAERRALAEYLAGGGTLLADAICASGDFATAFRRELSLALDGRPLEAVPADDPLLTDAFGGYDVRTVEVRSPQPSDDGQPLAARLRREAPRLEGIRVAGRWAVVFSPLDLSCALESHEAIQCRGYRSEDAARIALNVLLYSINQ